jgi:TonB family protein
VKFLVYIFLFLFIKSSLGQDLDSLIAPKLNVNSTVEFELVSQFKKKFEQLLKMNGQVVESKNKYVRHLRLEMCIDEIGNSFDIKLVKSSNIENYDSYVINKFKKTQQWNPAYLKNTPIFSKIELLIDEGLIKQIKVLSINKDVVLKSTLPTFRGGEKELFKFIDENIKHSKEQKNKGVVGITIVRFQVDSIGRISEVTVRQSSGYQELDIEAIRIVSIMPSWISAIENGKRLNKYCDLQITFGKKGEIEKLKQKQYASSNKYFNDGMKQFQADNLKAAKENYKKAYQLNCYHSDALYNLGVSYFKLNKKDSACICWNDFKINFAKQEADELIKKYCSN